jgi:phage shock protein B
MAPTSLGIGITLIPFVFVLGILFIVIGLPMLLGFMMLNSRRQTRGLNDDQLTLLQQTWQRLGRMEDRMTNLETILIEHNAGREGMGESRRERKD